MHEMKVCSSIFIHFMDFQNLGRHERSGFMYPPFIYFSACNDPQTSFLSYVIFEADL